ncbi:hypothetical protein Cch01nite_42720 [Cellulomonas chitinilytica]|uniref:DUF4126 domain-containing protein n=1 Tax=Cellulomonas chitinilytica TaxID=398759 RepID=A0A919P7Q5_9CELL|nr:hypothetical protein [Cellulomonas chitinilytica]GIG23548.1 hypothetical protein Cch01nite_42720 [Cellulomonas chitinilytica]
MGLHRTDLDHTRRRRAPAGLVLRAALLGWAAGARSTFGVVAPTLSQARRRTVLLGAGVAALGEIVGDKLPVAGSRLEHHGPLLRAASGAGGAVVLARREGAGLVVPALAGAVGGLAGSYGGAAWRSWAVGRMPDWQAALVEDAVAVGAAFVATRSPRVVV